MRYHAVHIVILVAAFLFMLFCGKNVGASEYITVQEFNAIHPEQVGTGKIFSELVKAKGASIQKGVQKKSVKIAFIYPGEQASDYWRRSITSFKARMDEIRIQFDMMEYFSKPVVDYREQEKQIKKALDRMPDYLVFTLDINKHKRILERIVTERKPKIILQNITTPLKSWEGKQPFLYVGFDHTIGARLIAQYYIRKTYGTGQYAVLFFSQGYVSTMRGNTFIEYLEINSNLQLVSSYYTDGNREKSKHATTEILNEFPDIKFIYACSTDVALGAIDSLKEKGVQHRVMVNGWGGGSKELEMIESRNMDITVMRMNDDNGVAMAEAIKYDIEGRGNDVPTIYSGNFVLVEKGINQNNLNKLKKRAFRYSGMN
jgi:autoinducer 2-binding periplasmic protein LuxP